MHVPTFLLYEMTTSQPGTIANLTRQRTLLIDVLQLGGKHVT